MEEATFFNKNKNIRKAMEVHQLNDVVIFLAPNCRSGYLFSKETSTDYFRAKGFYLDMLNSIAYVYQTELFFHCFLFTMYGSSLLQIPIAILRLLSKRF